MTIGIVGKIKDILSRGNKPTPPPALSDSEAQMKVIQRQFSELRNIVELPQDRLLLLYLGDFMEGDSFRLRHLRNHQNIPYTELAKANTRLPAYAEMMNRMHLVLRVPLISRLKLKLVEDALQPETQVIIHQLINNQKQYREIAEKIMKANEAEGKGYIVSTPELEGREDIKALKAASGMLCDKLRKSELGDEHATVPLKLAGESLRVPNTSRLGAFLFALREGQYNLTDPTKRPDEMTQYLREQMGTGQEITSNLHIKLASHPQLAASYSRSVAESLDDMKNVIIEARQPLQMMMMLKERSVGGVYALIAEKLLDSVGLPHAPKYLESELEYKLLLDTVAAKLPKKFQSDISLLQIAGTRSDEAKAAIAHLATYKKSGDRLWDSQIALLQGYVQMLPLARRQKTREDGAAIG